MLLGVDVGGTFTDAALLDGDRLVTAKAPTTPDDQSRGVIDAVRAALREADADASEVARFVHGMTVGTNALLEHRTAKTALLATEGFVDLEELRRQNRIDLYRLCAAHPEPLVPPELRVPVPERTGPDGALRELDEEALRERLGALPEDCESVAVCLLWSFLHPEHEQRVARVLEDVRPELHVSTSHETAPVFREYERCATTIVDAATSPLMRSYLRELTRRAVDEGLPEPEVMLSSGGVAGADQAAAHGSWTGLSGPAGGAGWAAMGRGAPAGRLAQHGQRAQRVRRTRSAWTWAARRATFRSRWKAAPSSPASDRSPAGRWRCRWSTCTRSAPAAAASGGWTRAGPCAWARA